jgi:hypothetical protein
MLQKKINDSIIESIFKSINDFDKFYLCIANKEDLKLDNDIAIKFNKEMNTVEIYYKQYIYIVEEQDFDCIAKDFFQEIEQQKWQETNRKQKIEEEIKKNNIVFIGNHVHSIDISYINHMYEIKMMNTASTYSLYNKKLQELARILNIGDSIIVDNREIKTINDLVLFLKKRGFQNIRCDLQK